MLIVLKRFRGLMERSIGCLSLVRWMQEHFRLGIFTSATQRTVGNVLPLLEQAAGPGTPLFADSSLILHRFVGLLEPSHMFASLLCCKFYVSTFSSV